ncbi:MAG: acyl dehydratase [Steroidobacteraceae bacterium]
MAQTPIDVSGPWFEDLSRGQEYDAPAVTLTAGHAVLYQALCGDRLRLPLDHATSRRVTGRDEPLLHPLLPINFAIGQSTWASQRVKGNLFYRGLSLHQQVYLGDTLHTRTKIVALRQNQRRTDRAATGMAVLEVETRNQHGDRVLKFWRCPMLPCRDSTADTGHGDDLDTVGTPPQGDTLGAAVPEWSIDGNAAAWPGVKAVDLEAGQSFRIDSWDTVTAAPEFARATLNLAMAHTDARSSYLGQRLVYGGHVLAVAFAQVTRALPNLLTMLAWESCDHLAPVLEGDRLRTEVTLVARSPARAGTLLKLAVRTFGSRGSDTEAGGVETLVLDWVVWVMSA